MMALLSLLLACPLMAQTYNATLPVETMEKEGAPQAIQQAVDSKFSVFGGTVAGNVFVTTTVYIQGNLAIGNNLTVANGIGVRATKNVGQDLWHNTWVDLVFGAEDFDRGGLHSTTSSSETVTVNLAGLWFVECSLFVRITTAGVATRILINGTERSHQSLPGSLVVTPALSVSDIFSLSAGDTIKCQAFQNTGAAVVTDTGSTNNITAVRLF
jgi:hypothetical protein